MCARSVVFERQCFWSHPPPLALIIFPPPLPHGSLSLEREEFDGDILFRTEYFLYVNLYLRQEASLMWIDQGTDLWI